MNRWLALAAGVVVCDQWSKHAILAALANDRAVDVLPFFRLVLAYNTGAAFSFLAGAGGWQRGFFIALAVVASVWVVYLLRRHRGETLFCCALSLILGGAVGNVIDRIMIGAVVDFLDFHAAGYHFPAFNVADSSITCGAALLLWDGFRQRSPRES